MDFLEIGSGRVLFVIDMGITPSAELRTNNPWNLLKNFWYKNSLNKHRINQKEGKIMRFSLNTNEILLHLTEILPKTDQKDF